MRIYKSATEYLEIVKDERYNPSAKPFEPKFAEYKYRSVRNGQAGGWNSMAAPMTLEATLAVAKAKGWKIEEA